MLEFRFPEIASDGYPHLSQAQIISDEYYSSQTMSSGPPDLHKE